MKRRTKLIYLFLLIGGLLIIGTLWRRIPHEPQLLECAHRVASTADWSNQYNNNQLYRTYYFWLNPTEILHFRSKGNGLQGFRLRLDGSGSDTEIPELKLPQQDVPIEVSQDGRLLLWLTSGGNINYVHPRISIVTERSDQAPTEPDPKFSLVAPLSWQHFRVIVTEAGDHYQIINDATTKGESNIAFHGTFSPPSIFSDETLADSFRRFAGNDLFPGPPREPGNFEATNVFPVDYIVHHQKGPMIEHTLHIGKDRAVENVCMSPDGSRIFFEEKFPAKGPLSDWVYKQIPQFSPKNGNEKRVFVIVDIKSGSRQELATYQAPYPQNNRMPMVDVHDVQWASDGKQLSFIFDDNLYTIPAK